MSTPANALDITAAGLVKFNGSTTFSGVTTTNHATLVGAASNGITSVGPSATAGQILRSGGASADPAYSTATYPATAGTAGKVLVSDGTNIVSSTPTFPNASATSGKFIRSDGTNWIASTPTLPTTAGTSGKVLVSDGTNFVSSTPTFPNASASSGKLISSDGTNWIASTPTLPTTGGTASTLLRSDGTNWVNTSAFKVSSADIVTNTAQPMVAASQLTSQANASGDGTSFDVIFDQVNNENGSNFSTTTGKYTCPTAGFYQVSYLVTFTGITAAMNDGYHQVLSSAGSLQRSSWNPGAIRTAANEASCAGALIVKMNASDTIYINVNISNGAKVASTKQNFFNNFCYFSVQLVG